MRNSATDSGSVIRPGRLVRASRARVSRVVQLGPVVGLDEPADVGEPVDQPVERRQDRVAVLGADVEPDVGMPAGDAGHVAEAARGEAQQRGVLLGAVGGQPHQRRRGQVRNVADHRDDLVVALRREGDDIGTERRRRPT